MRISEFHNKDVGFQKVPIPTHLHNMEISRKVKQDLLLQLLMKAFVCNEVHSRQRDYFDIYISSNYNVNLPLELLTPGAFTPPNLNLITLGLEKVTLTV